VMVETVLAIETSVHSNETTRRCITEDSTLQLVGGRSPQNREFISTYVPIIVLRVTVFVEVVVS
jgi:hypothetical protein